MDSGSLGIEIGSILIIGVMLALALGFSAFVASALMEGQRARGRSYGQILAPLLAPVVIYGPLVVYAVAGIIIYALTSGADPERERIVAMLYLETAIGFASAYGLHYLARETDSNFCESLSVGVVLLAISAFLSAIVGSMLDEAMAIAGAVMAVECACLACTAVWVAMKLHEISWRWGA